jgi:hypothetical protein
MRMTRKAMAGDKFVNPTYSRNSGNPPLDMGFSRGPAAKPKPTPKPKTWGAGDPNYVKDMIARGKAKKTNKVIP